MRFLENKYIGFCMTVDIEQFILKTKQKIVYQSIFIRSHEIVQNNLWEQIYHLVMII